MKIGFVILPYAGHLYPLTALARKMKSRGHEIVLIGVPDIAPYARAAGLDFVPYCEREFPVGSIAKNFAPASKLHGIEAAQWALEQTSIAILQAALEHLPAALAKAGVEALVIDTIHAFLEVIPISLGMPYAHASAVLNIDFSGVTPPSLVSFPYEDSPEARERNLEAVKTTGELFARLAEVAVAYAERIGLKIDWTDPGATLSKLAIVSQVPKEFDFPGIPWPPQFHYAGPFFDDEGREPIPFPWEKLDGRPLVYASMGTMLNGSESVFKTIFAAVAKLPEIQVVVSKGNNLELAQLGAIPANVIVVEKAPQLEVLKRSALCITHAGLNTTLESLGQGVPMVAIPVGFDQPGIAVRIAHHGVGEFIEFEDLNADRLFAAVQKVLNTPSYRDKAQYFKKVIAQRHGLDVAAEALEKAFEKADAYRPLELSRS